MPLGVEPTHQAILSAIAAHRAESRERWRTFDRRLDSVEEKLEVIPSMQTELAANTQLTKQYAEDEAFKRGVNRRAKVMAVWAALVGSVLGALATWKALFGGAPPPPGIGPQ